MNAGDEREGRSLWGAGPWDDEPDALAWRTLAGYTAQAKRSLPLGYWCGYVAVPPGHPCHGRERSDLPDLTVHGGVTWAGKAAEGGAWWIGFDCTHAYDARPSDRMIEKLVGSDVASRGVYRDLGFVRMQCERLAQQLHELLS